jgi:proline iminopeptidase
MAPLFPVIEPNRSGMLEVGGDQSLYWEECGNPAGTPAVVLHGGPGSGCAPSMRRLFDPDAYRIILYDQRGAGRSQPRVDVLTDLDTNTTPHLLADLAQLREHLDIERWVMYGSSWGVTLGVAYAELHPDQVRAMVLSSVTMTRRQDIHRLYHETGRFYPRAWRRFRDQLPVDARGGDLVEGYYRLLNQQPDVTVRQRAADAWCAWEDAASPLPGGEPNPRYEDPAFRMTFARIVTHYFHHNAWLTDNQLLDGVGALRDTPAVLIHGHLDRGTPIDTVWDLARAWPTAELIAVDTGHTGGGAMLASIIDATNKFADPR